MHRMQMSCGASAVMLPCMNHISYSSNSIAVVSNCGVFTGIGMEHIVYFSTLNLSIRAQSPFPTHFLLLSTVGGLTTHSRQMRALVHCWLACSSA
jgi:hypothetical protein